MNAEILIFKAEVAEKLERYEEVTQIVKQIVGNKNRELESSPVHKKRSKNKESKRTKRRI